MRRGIVGGVLAATCVLIGWGGASAPELPAGVVVKTTFETTEADIADVGTGFLFDAPGRGVVLVTALHVFGPPAGLDRWMTEPELPALTRGGSFRDAFTGETVGSIGAVVRTPGARLPSAEDRGADYAVFEVGASPAEALRPGAMAVGDSAWIASPGFQGGRLFPTLRLDAPEDVRAFVIPDDLQLPFGISGSPILDRDGDVVAIVVRLGRGPGGERAILATPIEAVLDGLAAGVAEGLDSDRHPGR